LLYIFFSFVLTAALYVRSSDVIAVVGIIFICILMCYFGADWWYFSQISVVFTDYRIFSPVIFKVLKYWLMCENLSLLIDWKCII
jgi:hypothetical protein